MPESPDTYRAPSASNSEPLRTDDGQQRGGGGLYQSYRYIKFRAGQKRKQRAIDEERVHEIYQNLEERSFKDYMAWMEGDNPLCVDCLEEGLIKPGRVLDHKVPIEQGGSVFDTTNHQWLCDHHHNLKRATEDRA
jgi:5-methylcytosine-specific restriction endonuclease McrA